jgi:hypothetical protein
LTPQKEQWQARFLKALAERPIITRAARKAGISRATAYNHKEADPEFRTAWEEALEEGVDGLVDTAWGRALEGESDTLTIFLLKNHRPEVYRDKSTLDLNVSNLSDEELVTQTAAALAGDGSPGPDAAGSPADELAE